MCTGGAEDRSIGQVTEQGLDMAFLLRLQDAQGHRQEGLAVDVQGVTLLIQSYCAPEIALPVFSQHVEDESEPGGTQTSGADTVSITGGADQGPLIADLVSISAAARVGSEVANAQKSVAESEQEELDVQVPPLPEPKEDDGSDSRAAENDEAEDSSGTDEEQDSSEASRVDVVA